MFLQRFHDSRTLRFGLSPSPLRSTSQVQVYSMEGGRTLVSIKALSAAGSGTNHPTIVCTTEGRNNAHSSSSFALVVLPRIIILFDLLSPIVEIVLFVVVVPAQIIQVSGNAWKGRASPNVPRVSRPGCFITLV